MKFLLFLIFHHLIFCSCRVEIKNKIQQIFKTNLEENNFFIGLQYLATLIITYILVVLIYIIFIDQGYGFDAFRPSVFFQRIR